MNKLYDRALPAAFGLFLLDCSNSNIETFALEKDKPVRINECTVVVSVAYSDLFDAAVSCDAPASAVHSQQWWGPGIEPGAFSLSLGDCVRLRSRYYCVIEMSPPTLRLTYEASEDSSSHILKMQSP